MAEGLDMNMVVSSFLKNKMKIRFYIDPETKAPHIYKHSVNEDEVRDILECPGEDRPGKEGSRISTGQTEAGRYLKVIYVLDSKPDNIFVITAYDVRAKALTAYKRRLKKRR